MCWPKRKLKTNANGQATSLWICHCQAIQIRVFHATWFTFWLCFFGWFATANLYPQISADLGLTEREGAIAGGCSVASTVIFRVIIGWLCDKIGSRKSYIILLLISAFPVTGMAFVTSPTGYIIVSSCIGIVGAAFVITQHHTTAMFAGNTVGTANGTAAGWGNFGGGCANFFMPLLYDHLKHTYNLSNSTSWRLCMVIPGLSYIVMAVIYWFVTVDKPTASKEKTVDTEQQNETQHQKIELPNLAAHSVADKSFSELENAEPLQHKTATDDGTSVFSLGCMDCRTWILFLTYAACFGIELTVLRFAVEYLMYSLGVEQEFAGLIILFFAFCNLFARSLGGFIADVVSQYTDKSLQGRVWSLFILLLLESVFLILFSLGEFVDSLSYTVFMLIMFSLCVQAAEGVTFAIVPFVQPNAIGIVAGIVGAGGNMGAMLFAFFIFTNVPHILSYFYAWLILGIFVFIVSFATLFIQFSEEEIKAADQLSKSEPAV